MDGMKEKIKTVTLRAVLSVYWQEMSKNRLLVSLCLVGMAFGTAISLTYPLFYKSFFDLLAAGNGNADVISQLIQILVFMLAVHFVETIVTRLSALGDAQLQARVMASLRERSLASLLDHSYSFFSNSFTGALVQKVNRLQRSFERFWDAIFYGFFPLTIRIVGSIFFVIHENIVIGSIMIAWTALFVLFNILFSLYKTRFDSVRARLDSKVTATLADAITNAIPIKLFTGKKAEEERFHAVTDSHRKSVLVSWRLGVASDAVQNVLFIFLEFFLFYISLFAWRDGTLSVGGIILIQGYFMQLSGRLWDIGRRIRDTYEAITDSKEMVEIMNAPLGVQDEHTAKDLVVTKGKIQFQNVLFMYPSHQPVINRLSFTIKGGERIALIGSSGAGKSTLISLLLRFYDINSGSILIDGRNIARVTQESLRGQIGFVPQEPILFHRTLLENIRYGLRRATEADVYTAARLAHCDEFIKELPKGYDTLVGERGIKLSGGERQRIAIARAILKDAPILILDEATSSLDSQSEILIQDALNTVMKGKTTIAIAHRLSTIRKMDRIIVLADGAIQEEGSHAQLLAKRTSQYKRLWNLQSGGFLKDDTQPEIVK